MDCVPAPGPGPRTAPNVLIVQQHHSSTQHTISQTSQSHSCTIAGHLKQPPNHWMDPMQNFNIIILMPIFNKQCYILQLPNFYLLADLMKTMFQKWKYTIQSIICEAAFIMSSHFVILAILASRSFQSSWSCRSSRAFWSSLPSLSSLWSSGSSRSSRSSMI